MGRRSKWALILLTLLAAFNASADTALKPWTVLVYWAVGNDLYEFSIPYLEQFKKIHSNINIIAQYDRGHGFNTERIQYPCSKSLQVFPKDLDSASPKTLSDFLVWGVENYPAKNYLLVIGSHGSNWSGVIADDGVEQSTYMELKGLRTALNRMNDAISRVSGGKKKKLDIAVFDACRMAFVETLHALKGSVGRVVATPFDMMTGFDHVTPLQLAGDPKGFGMDAIAHSYVKSFAEKYWSDPITAASVLNPNRVGVVLKQFEKLIAFANAANPDTRARIRAAIHSSVNEYGDHAFDVFAIARAIGEYLPEALIASDAFLNSHGQSDHFFREKPLLEYRNSRNGVLHQYAYPAGSVIRANSVSEPSASTSGLGITCADEIDLYARTGSGKKMPHWVQWCREWLATRSPP